MKGALQVCDSCARSKAKSRAVRKKRYTRVSNLGEKLFVHDWSIPEGFIGNRYWVGLVENYRRYSWIFFIKTKLQLPKKMEEFLEKMTSHGKPVKYPHCDNMGEHQYKLQKVWEKGKFTLYYTTEYTTQLNGIIKRRFEVNK